MQDAWRAVEIGVGLGMMKKEANRLFLTEAEATAKAEAGESLAVRESPMVEAMMPDGLR